MSYRYIFTVCSRGLNLKCYTRQISNNYDSTLTFAAYSNSKLFILSGGKVPLVLPLALAQHLQPAWRSSPCIGSGS